MGPKRFLIAVLSAAVFISTQAMAVDEAGGGGAGGPASGEEAVYHKVVPRDTLWDITGKYLGDPFKWPGVWKVNPDIKNPHLIYPGNIVRVTPDGVEVLEPSDARAEGLSVIAVEEGESVVVLDPEEGPEYEPEPEGPVTRAAPPGPKVKGRAVLRRGFISAEELKGSGAVVGQKEKRMYSSGGDEVVLSFKDRPSVKAGDRYTVFTVGRMLKHPETGKGLGYEIDILGSLNVTKTGGVVEGVIDNSYKEVPEGARLRPYSDPVLDVALTEADADVTGVIVTSIDAKENLSAGDIAYIDKGVSDGLKAGNVMRIFRAVPKAADPMNAGEDVSLPPLELGTLVVIEAGEGTSTGVVVKSFKSIVRGDRVSTLRAE